MPKLYAFQPHGHGPLSFFILADTIQEAVGRIKHYISASLDPEELGEDFLKECQKFTHAGTYHATIYDVGEVVTNYNS